MQKYSERDGVGYLQRLNQGAVTVGGKQLCGGRHVRFSCSDCPCDLDGERDVKFSLEIENIRIGVLHNVF